MLFLADESCDFAVVRALGDGGHDVVAVADVARGARDPEVVALAREGGRILLTEDKDFGWLR
jgi:predicted nuclease of predicted toxin-antitoxin system